MTEAAFNHVQAILLFPAGLLFDGAGFGTPQISVVFDLLAEASPVRWLRNASLTSTGRVLAATSGGGADVDGSVGTR